MAEAVRQSDDTFRFYVTHALHAHEGEEYKALLYLQSYPCHRKLRAVMKAHIQAQSAAGIAPRLILPSLQAMALGHLVALVDICNEKHKQKVEEFGGREVITITVLISLLKDTRTGISIFNWRPMTVADSSLFLMRKDMRTSARTYYEVLEIDGTYKINWYDMPLVHIMTVILVVDR